MIDLDRYRLILHVCIVARPNPKGAPPAGQAAGQLAFLFIKVYQSTHQNRLNLDGDALLVGSDDANDVRHETLSRRGPHQAIAQESPSVRENHNLNIVSRMDIHVINLILGLQTQTKRSYRPTIAKTIPTANSAEEIPHMHYRQQGQLPSCLPRGRRWARLWGLGAPQALRSARMYMCTEECYVSCVASTGLELCMARTMVFIRHPFR